MASDGNSGSRGRGYQNSGGDYGDDRQDGYHAAAEYEAGRRHTVIITTAAIAPARHGHVASSCYRHLDGHVGGPNTLHGPPDDQRQGEQQSEKATDFPDTHFLKILADRREF